MTSLSSHYIIVLVRTIVYIYIYIYNTSYPRCLKGVASKIAGYSAIALFDTFSIAFSQRLLSSFQQKGGFRKVCKQ